MSVTPEIKRIQTKLARTNIHCKSERREPREVQGEAHKNQLFLYIENFCIPFLRRVA